MKGRGPVTAALAGMAVCLAGAEPSAAAVRRALLSVDGLNVPADRSIYGFRIETVGVKFRAVCRLPVSWQLKSIEYEDGDGLLEGRADLHGEWLRRLQAMYLVDVYDIPVSKGSPAAFAGWMQIGSRQAFEEWHGRRVTLKLANFRLVDARRCPDPGPIEP